MTAVAEALEQVRSTLVDVLRFDDPAQWSDDELLAATASIEAAARRDRRAVSGRAGQ